MRCELSEHMCSSLLPRECLEEPGHEPLPCDLWNKWQTTIEDYHKGWIGHS